MLPTCFVIVAPVVHGLKFGPVQALVTVFIYFPDHVLNLSLYHMCIQANKVVS